MEPTRHVAFPYNTRFLVPQKRIYKLSPMFGSQAPSPIINYEEKDEHKYIPYTGINHYPAFCIAVARIKMVVDIRTGREC